jgi:heme exporter protein D
LNWNKSVRQVHRWLSIAFTAAVIVNIVAMVQEKSAVWVGLMPLLPLALRPVLVRAAVCREVAQRAPHLRPRVTQ